MIKLFKRLIEEWKLKRLLKKEIERLGVIELAKTLDSAQEQKEFIIQYYLKGGYN
jgi:hypothetical protein